MPIVWTMPFPSPPWRLRGRLWVSSFAVGRGTPQRPAGVYAAAFADYQPGGVLAYRELLVARLVRDGAVPRVRITDIWVDSAVSRDGGWALWAIPKELADLQVRGRTAGVALHAVGEAAIAGSSVATARATGVRLPVVPRVPVRLSTVQERADGTAVRAGVAGRARISPCRIRWEFAAGGPLSWLRGRRPVAFWQVDDFAITFG